MNNSFLLSMIHSFELQTSELLKVFKFLLSRVNAKIRLKFLRTGAKFGLLAYESLRTKC
jgi:hypothetical protein